MQFPWKIFAERVLVRLFGRGPVLIAFEPVEIDLPRNGGLGDRRPAQPDDPGVEIVYIRSCIDGLPIEGFAQVGRWCLLYMCRLFKASYPMDIDADKIVQYM